MESALVLLFSLMLVQSSSAQLLCYVESNDISSQDCPGQPCLTLGQYIHDAEEYFTTGTTFIFLDGQHTLQRTINLTSVANITLTQVEDYPQVNIACMSEGALVFENVSNVIIEGLVFISQSYIKKSLLYFVSSMQVRLLNITFQGNRQFRAVYSNQSFLTIMSCHFEDNIGDNGGALYAEHSVIMLTGSNFTQNRATKNGGAIYALTSSINILLKEYSINRSLQGNETMLIDNSLTTIFLGNEAPLDGGAMYLQNSTLTMSGASVIFANNSANQGGAICCRQHSVIYSTTKKLHFLNNTAGNQGGAIILIASSLYFGSKFLNLTSFPEIVSNVCVILAEKAKVKIINITTIFSHNHAELDGGAVFLYNATAYLSGTSMIFDSNSAKDGGVFKLQESSVVSNTKHLRFNNNVASTRGGAITSQNSCIILGNYSCNTYHYFVNNSCGRQGGAISHIFGLLAVLGNSLFTENHAYIGGAIYVGTGKFFRLSCMTLFSHNAAIVGGAIAVAETSVVFTGKLFVFRNNSAKNEDGEHHDKVRWDGGAIAIEDSQIKAWTKKLKFIENFASRFGGAITYQGSQLTILSACEFIQNKAKFGGAIHLTDSTATFSGRKIIFYQNSAVGGGAVNTLSSFIRLMGYTAFSRNEANEHGGAIFGVGAAKFMFNGETIFHDNIALYGGGIYAINANITFNNTVQFIYNSAINGGAMFFEGVTILIIERGTNLTTSYNHAVEYGGVIYHLDSGATTSQCEYNYRKRETGINIPYCFIDLKGITISYRRYDFIFSIKSNNDSAGKDGSYIYGGFLDRCQISVSYKDRIRLTVMEIIRVKLLGFPPIINDTNKGIISSKPYQLCVCRNLTWLICYTNHAVQVYRGQKFNVSLVATAQGNVLITSSTKVTVKLNPTARLNLNQSSQVIKYCSAATYNVYSTEEYEELVVYPADGPCIDRGFARAVIEVTLLPCPDGFTQSNEQCVCEERLQAYDANCTISEMILITKRSINFWMSALYINESYQGLILYEICPIEYCKSGNISMYLDNVNIQCDFNRTGILCGACATNYSLLLGSSTCQICSNMYLSLLVPFALAGLGLVIFLTILRLTVATGLINSLILYANIVQANKSLFFPPNTTNLLTVFIAWMNLDLGFKTCFYDGMDGYTQTWLQFAFPLYVWILIILIIISSRYSIKVSRLIGSNPIAVLATLLLLSYTKILKIIIEVFSSVKLNYPDNKKVTVWLKDANVPYMEHKHLILTVTTFCITISFFLPYTLLLLLGYKFYSFRWCRKYFHCWLMRFRPLLDSYNAPYNIHHRYWTGLMLLVRCVLYIVFCYNSLGETNGSLLAIIIVFVFIGFLLGFMRVYKKMFVNIIEVSTCFNLIILSTVTLANIHTPALVHISVGITFCTFISVCAYHLYFISYIKRILLTFIERLTKWFKKIWLISSARLVKWLKHPKPNTVTDQPLLVIPKTPPTKTVIEAIREPLLDN